MLSAYETMTTTQKNQFKDTANKLLATNFFVFVIKRIIRKTIIS